MPKAKWKNFTQEQIQEMVKISTSYSEVAKKMGYSSGSGIETVKQVIKNYNINTDHFKGHAWNKSEDNLSWNTIRK